jgi:hypothetical protein
VSALRPQTVVAQTTAKQYLALATGSQETPSVDTPAVAFARFTLGADNKMAYEIHISPNLKAPLTAMHLHRGRPGVAGPVVYPITNPTADKPNVTVGSFDFMPADQADLDSQGFYLNIHTEANPGGEIRGQVVAAPPSLASTAAK